MSDTLIRIRQMLWLIGACALCACGGSGGGMNAMNSPTSSLSSSQACSNCGTAVVSLTDAPGDFISYIVNVVSLQLKRADGTAVETVPVTTQVDFAQLVNLSEILSAEQIPAGNYVSATLTLDYSSATIVVDNGTTGVTIAAGSVINGATMLPLAKPSPTQMTLTLKLGTGNSLIITPNAIANLALDFNLAASNTIAPSDTAPATVTVNPVLTAGLVPDTTRQIRVRGPLVSADAGTNSFIIGVRPFFNNSGTAGQFNVNTADATAYSINNVNYTGSAGLTQLASLSAGTMVVAYGAWDRTTQMFTAANVLAGSSVPGIMHDSVEGTVLSRTGNTLLVGNGLICPKGMDFMGYSRQVTVALGAGTVVTEDGQAGSFTIQDISVGQHLQLAGTLGKDASGDTTLDATAGGARLMLTPLTGLVTTLAANLVTVNVNSLDGHPPSIFNFAGTGATTAQNASSAAYSVGVPATLSTAGLSGGVPVSFEGFVAPFGQAPPDFDALTLLSYADTRGLLQVRWAPPGDTAPFASLTSTQLLVNQAALQMSTQHRVRIGFSTLDPSTLSTGLQLVPDAAAAFMWLGIIHLQSRSSENFSVFSDYVTALMADLNGSAAVLQIDAAGSYAASTGVLSVDQIIVLMND